MSNIRPFSEIKPLNIKALATALKQEGTPSMEAGLKLAKEAHSFGLNVRDYVLLAAHKESDHDKDGLNAYEKLLCELDLPIRNDFSRGVHLQAASETFETFAGTRALFPEVIDDVVRFATRQVALETVTPMLANSRTIAGAELLSTVIDDDSKERDTFLIAEGSNIPVRTIKTSEKSVKIYKHGSALRTTYEFNRRVSLDIMVPFANRIAKELELSKVKAATAVLINGDGAYGAAAVINQSSYNTPTGVTATNGKISWPHLLYWLVKRAEAGVPIDTVVMNWDGFFQWTMMFGTQQTAAGMTMAESLRMAGVDAQQMPQAINLAMALKPVLSSSVPAGYLIGYSVGDTLEELVEAGSNISETERTIRNQTMIMTRTENTGYRLVYGDTRSIYNFGA